MDRSEAPSSDRSRFIVRLLIAAAVVLLLLLAWRWMTILLLVFGSILIAVMLRGIADPIRDRTPLGDGLSLAAAVLVVVGVLAGAGFLVGAQVSNQISALSAALPGGWQSLRQEILQLPFGERLVAAVQGGGMQGAMSQVGSVVGRLGGAISATAGALADLLVVVFGGIYLAIKPRTYREGLLRLIPGRAREPVREALQGSGRALKLWLLGTLATMVSVGVLTGLGTWAIGLPAPIALGLIAGIAEFVPLIGPILSAVPALLLAATIGPEMILWTLLLYVGIQQLESNVLLPIIERKAVSLPPILTLYAVLALGALFGILGVLFATPLAVVAFVFVKRLYLEETLGEEVQLPGEKSE